MTDISTSVTSYPAGANAAIKRREIDRAPTSADYRNWNPGDEWYDTSSQDIWKYVGKFSGSAVWAKIGGDNPQAESFVSDSGTATPNVSFQIILLGQVTPNTSGISTNASGSTVNIRMQSPYALGDFDFTGGDVNVARSNAGNDVIINVANTDNTSANSDAAVLIQTGGASAGDAVVAYEVAGTTSWTVGIDNSDSDTYVIAASGALGTNNTLKITTPGVVSFPQNNLFFQTIHKNKPIVIL